MDGRGDVVASETEGEGSGGAMTLDDVFERGVELGRVRGFGGEPRESAGFGVFGVRDEDATRGRARASERVDFCRSTRAFRALADVAAAAHERHESGERIVG